MQRLEVGGAVWTLYGSLGVKGLKEEKGHTFTPLSEPSCPVQGWPLPLMIAFIYKILDLSTWYSVMRADLQTHRILVENLFFWGGGGRLQMWRWYRMFLKTASRKKCHADGFYRRHHTMSTRQSVEVHLQKFLISAQETPTDKQSPSRTGRFIPKEPAPTQYCRWVNGRMDSTTRNRISIHRSFIPYPRYYTHWAIPPARSA